MEVTQSYARPSAGVMAQDGMHLDVATEQSRPTVHLEAMVKDSLAYARLMLALHAVVSSDYRPQQKDHSAYQAWVQQRYLEELSGELVSRAQKVPGLMHRREALAKRVDGLEREIRTLEMSISGADYQKCKRAYFDWLYVHNKEAWYPLDPVVSVHPECLIFEVFSMDESSYGRVTVPMDRLDAFGTTLYGTTNVDFSQALADEIARVRSYRPAWLQIGAGGVTVATGAGERLEKKIDLPPTWVRGFLQVQSAAAFPGTDVTLSGATVAEVLSLLRRQREDRGPRSLRFVLKPGEKPSIVVEPWNVVIQETEHAFDGDFTGEIRVWGRRRLFTIQSLLPYADKVQVRMLGTGMPSYWMVFQKTHRFDLGLSGWTQNDWSRAARFDLLASTGAPDPQDVATAATALSARLRLSPSELASETGLSRDAATSALQRLCAEGRAMYDHANGVYRWRQLLPDPVRVEETEQDKRVTAARKLLARKAVKWVDPSEDEDGDDSFGAKAKTAQVERCRALVRGEKEFHVTLDVDSDGRVQYAECTCSWHRREKLRKGPCAHILAVSALAPQQVALQIAQRADASSGPPRVNQIAGKNFVFTGALTLFTREQAEAMVQQAGGTAAGSVSKNTHYVVAGDKAGSKLAKAQQLGIPVLTEQQFKAMLP